jgi:hypothetical protein
MRLRETGLFTKPVLSKQLATPLLGACRCGRSRARQRNHEIEPMLDLQLIVANLRVFIVYCVYIVLLKYLAGNILHTFHA